MQCAPNINAYEKEIFLRARRKNNGPPDRQEETHKKYIIHFTEIQFSPVLPSSAQFCPVFPSFIQFSSVLLSFSSNFTQFRPVSPSFAQFCPVLPSFFPVFPSFSPNFYHLKNLNFLTRAPKKKSTPAAIITLFFPALLLSRATSHPIERTVSEIQHLCSM